MNNNELLIAILRTYGTRIPGQRGWELTIPLATFINRLEGQITQINSPTDIRFQFTPNPKLIDAQIVFVSEEKPNISSEEVPVLAPESEAPSADVLHGEVECP